MMSFSFISLSIFLIGGLKFLSDNFNMYITLNLTSVDCLLLDNDAILLTLCMASDVELYVRH